MTIRRDVKEGEQELRIPMSVHVTMGSKLFGFRGTVASGSALVFTGRNGGAMSPDRWLFLMGSLELGICAGSSISWL